MKIKKIETHKYAPELNKVTLESGAVVAAPGVTTIADFRKLHAPVKSGKYAKITFSNKTYAGYFDTYKNLFKFINERIAYHNTPADAAGPKISLKFVGA